MKKKMKRKKLAVAMAFSDAVVSLWARVFLGRAGPAALRSAHAQSGAYVRIYVPYHPRSK